MSATKNALKLEYHKCLLKSCLLDRVMIGPTVKHVRNVTMHVLYNGFWFCHKHNSSLLVLIQPSSPSTKELHFISLIVLIHKNDYWDVVLHSIAMFTSLEAFKSTLACL